MRTAGAYPAVFPTLPENPMTVALSIDNPLASVSEAMRTFLKREHKLFINGEWADAQSGRGRNLLDPATGQVISTAADADAAIRSSRDAFENGPWRCMKPKERAAIIYRIGGLNDKYAVELAEVDVLDEGSS